MPAELPQPFLPESRSHPNPNIHRDPLERRGHHFLLRRRQIGLRGPENLADAGVPRHQIRVPVAGRRAARRHRHSLGEGFAGYV